MPATVSTHSENEVPALVLEFRQVVMMRTGLGPDGGAANELAGFAYDDVDGGGRR